MNNKIKLFLKWSFVFSVLICWSYFVVSGSITGNIINKPEKEIYIQSSGIERTEINNIMSKGFSKDFNIPFYSETSAGIEKASSSEIIDVLFNHGFEIQEKIREIPADRCSLRAENGNLNVDGKIFENNKFSFNVNYLTNGKGSLTGQRDGERFSASFDIKEILETNSEKLIMKAEGKGRLNREELNFAEIIISFDKLNNKVNVDGSGDLDFEAKNMDVDFIDGCFDEKKEFYLITDNGELGERRSIDEVREILDAHPELLDMYEGLNRLYKEYWWAALPGGFVIS